MNTTIIVYVWQQNIILSKLLLTVLAALALSYNKWWKEYESANLSFKVPEWSTLGCVKVKGTH